VQLNQLSSNIIQATMRVHSALGPGLLESVYQKCMLIELREMGFDVQAEVPVAINYHGQKVSEEGFRIDLLVENRIIVELKSAEEIKPVFLKQLLTYLRLAGKPLGFLINFNVPVLKDGIHRILNWAPEVVQADFFLKNQPETP
jgi:GxxExxY protein